MNPKTLFFTMSGLLVLSLVASLGLFYYSNTLLSDSAKELHLTDSQLVAAEDNLSYLQSLEKRTTQAKNSIGDIDNIFPKEKNQVEFIDQIRKLANEHNVDIGDQFNFPSSQDIPSGITQLTSSESVPGLVGMELDVSFSGTYENSMDFIEDLETFRRLVNIEKISIQSDNKGDDLSGTINLLVLVDTALQEPKATSSSPADANAQGGPQ